ncbi:MAG: hypothetical protein CMO16_05780 [Thaumarchaeota archaeon]|nr:hypothetical protein [Nitrososphaerota archaeon]
MILDYLLEHNLQVGDLIVEHMILVAIAESIAIGVGLTLGIAITRPRFKWLAHYVNGLSNIGQSVPSLSVIGLVIPLLGIGFTPAVFALFVYVVLPIIRNTYAGLMSVDKKILEASVGIGLDPFQVLRHVEIPLAFTIILDGIRISTVFCIATAALVFLIGAGGLGELIFTGIALVDIEMILAGAIPVALLAFGVDLLFGVLERIVIGTSRIMNR